MVSVGLRDENSSFNGIEKVNVLVVGSGGREHALLWACSKSSIVGEVYIAPGNGGTIEHNVNIGPEDFGALYKFAREHDCFTVVGQDKPLADGIVDYFRARGLPIFGPTAQQALLESSKRYGKQFMRDNGIPTADFETFVNSGAAIRYARSKAWNVVVKADGLAEGKGVFVCSSEKEAEAAIFSILDAKKFGSAGDRIIVEDKLYGKELSLFALCDGKNATYIGSAVDYKRLLDGGKGPNTGSMGAYSPASEFDPKLIDGVMKTVVYPTVEKTGFSGFLFVALMITEKGPMVLEFNARLGDPEAQVILPRLNFDLLSEMRSISNGHGIGVKSKDIFNELNATCVVMASKGYPFDHKGNLGRAISGVTGSTPSKNIIIFHAGTKFKDGLLITDGGRVLDVVGLDKTSQGSRMKAYEYLDRIHFMGEQYRRDINLEANKVYFTETQNKSNVKKEDKIRM